jgi:SAM-dependent methyltransferase
MDHARAVTESWERNAANWTAAVRGGLIASRTAGTDDAIVGAIVARKPARLLDVGCGEGWLVRRVVAATGCEAVGIDGAARLIADARAADLAGDYRLLDYEGLVANPAALDGPFDVIAFNYALFDERAAIVLAATRTLLGPDGGVVVQTLHPWAALPPGQPYRDGWQREDFAAFGAAQWTPMPWYFRTLGSWYGVLRDAGLTLVELSEPVSSAGGPPLSLVLVAAASRT